MNPHRFCVLIEEAIGDPMPCKTRERKLSKVALWILKALACLKQRRLQTFRFPPEGPRPAPHHWFSKTPGEKHSLLLFSKLTLVLAKSANGPSESCLRNDAATLLLT